MIRKALGLSVMVGCVSLFAFACGSDDKGDAYPNTDSFCAAKATLECSNSAGTCAVTSDVCKNARKGACTLAAQTASGEGRTYAPSKAEDCLNKTTDAYAHPTDAAKLEAFIDSCNRVFAGTKAKAAPCSSQYDCSGTLVCDLEKAVHICADKTTRTLNDQCNNAGDTCGTGLYCEQGAANICHPKRAAGDACNPTIPCVETTFCNGTTCVALAQTGEACKSNDQCTSTFCNDAGKCQTRAYPSETGSCKDFGAN